MSHYYQRMHLLAWVITLGMVCLAELALALAVYHWVHLLAAAVLFMVGGICLITVAGHQLLSFLWVRAR